MTLPTSVRFTRTLTEASSAKSAVPAQHGSTGVGGVPDGQIPVRHGCPGLRSAGVGTLSASSGGAPR